MEPDEIKLFLQPQLADCEIQVTGDGSHFDVTVIGESFQGMSSLNRQRTVFKAFGDKITSGAVHAVNIHAYTQEEWRKAKQLNVSVA